MLTDTGHKRQADQGWGLQRLVPLHQQAPRDPWRTATGCQRRASAFYCADHPAAIQGHPLTLPPHTLRCMGCRLQAQAVRLGTVA